jgi:hypothetical protein
MNTITITTKVETKREIKIPFFGKIRDSYYCCTGRDKYGYVQGITVHKRIISNYLSESDLQVAEPCSPAEFAAAFEEAHHNLRAEYEAIIEAQEGGK